jgi:hypothetical protein
MSLSSPIFHLPAELTQHILSFLDFPSLQSFRHTSHSSLTLVPPRLLHLAEIAYRCALYEKENKHAREAKAKAQSLRYEVLFHWCFTRLSDMQDLQNLHKSPVTRAQHLHCFTCYSYLDRDLFSPRQRTGSRSYGHSGAMRRFCIACGFRHNKWSYATYFRRGRTLPCATCERIAPTHGDARRLGMCSECFEHHQRDLAEREGQSAPGLSEEMKGVDESAAGDPVEDSSTAVLHTRKSLSQQLTGVEIDSSPRDITICQQSGNIWAEMPTQTAILRRAERCVHCWMVDHTYQPAISFSRPTELLCKSCWVEKANRCRCQWEN